MTSLLEIRQKAQGRQPTETDTRVNTRAAMHQAAAAYHARHNPPQAGADYWEWTIKDLLETARQHDNDPLIKALLTAALDDLEREYKRLQAAQDRA